MNHQSLKTIAFGLCLAMFAGASVAAPEQGGETASGILQLQHALRAKLEKPSGEYSRFDNAAIGKMERAQDKVFGILDGVESLDQLNVFQKTELSNLLDEIKSVLLANEQNRTICHRERKTGTNLLELRCETLADREARAREAGQMLRHDGISR